MNQRRSFLLTLLTLTLLLSSCGKNDIDTPYIDQHDIKGTWQLVERYTSSGGPGQWSSVTDGYTYTFTEDNVVITNKFDSEGNFIILSPDPTSCDEGCAEKFRRVTTD
ncbi:hypothetical protein [Roseivirga sp.]|uniref:hypothetical protein n=1 Tax=Roseivirga sp. TaxID=1964215 RepID=UPI002B27BA38|nr:hypothetical protein [Roseivirga sp.]